MTKRRKLRIRPKGIGHLPAAAASPVGRFLIIGILMAGAAVGAAMKTVHLLRHSKYFRVKTVEADPALTFIDRRPWDGLKGESIFTVDLQKFQRGLARQYPQVTQLKVAKYLPDKIAVSAQRRLPFAQAHVRNRMLVLDEKGVILSLSGPPIGGLPLISGVSSDRPMELGLSLGSEEVRVALEIIKEFRNYPGLSAYPITKVHAANLLNISFDLSNDLKIVLDGDHIARKMKLLNAVLSQGSLDFKDIKYIDLRFKEPIIGKRQGKHD